MRAMMYGAAVGGAIAAAVEAVGVPGCGGDGHDDYRMASDGWSLCTADDGSQGAHVEHTVAITDDGPRILTTV